ncbi:MAG: DNA/RNA non-specific endonuclease [Lachnospiraceae bacterium]|nr:DNA/RNA non-specific endonuclease [Lachnospiraceae bacterium]
MRVKRMLSAVLTVLIATIIGGCELTYTVTDSSPTSFSIDNIAPFDEAAYITVNDNQPFFTEKEYTSTAYESYGELDSLGRCTAATACIGTELMPTEDRTSIGSVEPSGWHSIKYDCVDGKYLYNRCHLIGYQLSGENTNEKNLITGTRFLNTKGMLPFENMVADYVNETDNHVMYRVTPIFEESNLLASGVLIEAISVEDSGEGICFNVYCYNIQPGIEINYLDGTSWEEGVSDNISDDNAGYIMNTKTKKFHLPDCNHAKKISEENREEFIGDREILLADGYVPCGGCNP